MWRCATVTEAELEQLRRIRNVIRLGRVAAIDHDRVVLEQGEIATDARTLHVDCTADGIRCDTEGNIWSSAGWVGEGYDGVHVFNSDGRRGAQIVLPEICANLCFGGVKRNRLYMAASQSVVIDSQKMPDCSLFNKPVDTDRLLAHIEGTLGAGLRRVPA